MEGLSINMANNIIIAENNIINGGKAIVLYSATNILIANNILGAEELVEGSEVQVDLSSAHVSIINNNTIYNLWEGIKVYAHCNVTIRNNTLLDCDFGITITTAYWDGKDDIIIENNRLIMCGILFKDTSGPILENNYLEDAVIVIDSSSLLIRFNVLRNTTIDLMNVSDVTIVNNTIYIEEGRDWYTIEGTAENVIIENNTIYTLPGSGEEHPPEEKTPEEKPTTPSESSESIMIFLAEILTFIVIIVGVIVIILKRRKS
ncbi:MAG: right-handed parallel beta-helix repeat-containing protein [Candidatus Odinarchaeota archaeon]|nr:right-handed parallel beta-helix repeat-containing protein [Candidatus Odinarchaeota archaeon]